MTYIERIELLLLIAAIVAMVARRLRVPYSIGLVLAGIVMALLPFSPEVELTKELVFTILLPPLIVEAAFQLRWQELRRELPVVLVLATIGVLLSALVTAVGMHFIVRSAAFAVVAFSLFVQGLTISPLMRRLGELRSKQPD